MRSSQDRVRSLCRQLALAITIVGLCAFTLFPAGTASAQPAQLGPAGSRLAAQDEVADFLSPDGLVGVFGITAGRVSYDEASATLTLDNVVAETVGFCKDGSVTLKLVGASSFALRDRYWYARYVEESGYYESDERNCNGSARIVGTGSFRGTIELCGNVSLEGGTVNVSGVGDLPYGVSCAALSMAGGKLDITLDESYGTVVQCKTLKMTSGTLRSTGTVSASESMAISGGSLTATSVEWSNLYIGQPFYGLALRCPSITVSGGAVKTSGVDCDSLTVSGGTLDATGSIACLKAFNMKGGTAKAGDGLHCGGDVVISKGKVNAFISCSKLAVKGGKVAFSNREDATAVFCENLIVSGGKIALSKLRGGIAIRCGKMTVNGGKVSLAKCDGIGVSCVNLRISKGTLLVDDQYDGESVCVVGGSLIMTGGMLKATRCYDDAVSVMPVQTGGETYRGKTKPVKVSGGSATVKGGSISLSVRRPSRYSAIAARSFSGKRACLKTVRGRMPAGFSFTAGGNTYGIVAPNYETASSKDVEWNHWNLEAYRDDSPSDHGYAVADEMGGDAADASGYSGSNHLGRYPGVILKRYGSAKTKASLGTVKFGGCNYSVTGIGAKALGTPRGAKVKSLTLANTMTEVGARAFSGAKSLELLRIDLFVDVAYKRNGTVKSAELGWDSKVAKNSFSKCGKANGKGLTARVAISSYEATATFSEIGSWKPLALKLKAMLVKHGLSKKAAVYVWNR